MVVGFTGTIDNHLPINKIFTKLLTLLIKIQLHAVPYATPIAHATLAFADSNKIRHGVLIQYPGSKDVTNVISNPSSVQLGELLALLKVLVELQTEPVNIFSDSQYAVQAVHVLAFSQLKDSLTPLPAL